MRILRLLPLLLIALLVICISVFPIAPRHSELQRLQAGPIADTPTSAPTGSPTVTSTPTDTPTPEPTGIDVLPPEVKSIKMVQGLVDTTESSQVITANIYIVDDLSGLQSATFRFEPWKGGTQFVDFVADAGNRTYGDKRSGLHGVTAVVPKYSAHGRWYLAAVTISDNANNSRTIPLMENGTLYLERLPMPSFPYFINGEDDGPPPTPQWPPLNSGGTPSPDELFMPALGK